jgi:hypothetical protein
MHVITGELRKDTFIKQGVGKDGQSTMYGLELCEVTKDYKTGEKSYTNYKALLFAASPAHIEYYNKTLVKGNWVSLSSEKLKIEVSECGQYIKLFMENARIDAAGYIEQAQQQQPAQQQGGYQQQATQQPQQQGQQQGFKQAPQQTQGQQQAKTPDLDDGWDSSTPF